MNSRSLRSLLLYIVTPLGIAGLVVMVSLYLSSPHDVRTHVAAKGAEVADTQDSHATTKFACPVSLTSNSNVEEKHEVEHRAQRMMDGKKFDEALASFRELAGMDPAFPGVNLDISMALSKLKQPAAAKQAVDAQLALSMCLAQLFPNELEPYCKAEGFGSTADCMKELGSIQQGSYLQAALVQMDVDHKAKPETVVQTARAVHPPKPARVEDETHVKKPVLVAHRDDAPIKAKRVPVANKNLMATGSGTDAALGAYSK